MAHRRPSSSTAAAPAQATVAETSQGPWDAWFESQQELFGTALDQLALAQQSMLKSWLGLFDAVATSCQAPLEGGLQLAWGGLDRDGRPVASSWTFAPPDAFGLATPLMQAWWAPWSPFLERGGEQLG